MFKLIYKISLIILLGFLLSIGVDHLYRQAYGLEYKFPKNILIHPEITEKYTLVKLGNSHSEDGLTFEKYKVKYLNLASVAQTFEYDLALLKMNSRQIEENAIIIINVSPISFSQKKADKKENFNTRYYDGRLSPFLIPHIDISEYLQVQFVPFVRAGYLWRTTYAQDAKEEAMSNFAENFKEHEKPASVPAPVSNVITSAPDIFVRSDRQTFNVSEIQAELKAPLEPSSEMLVESTRFMVNKWNSSGGFDTESFETNRNDLQAIIDYCLEHNWRPVLVTLPMNQVLLDGLEPNYLDRYIYDNLKKVDLQGIPYINFITNTQLTQNRYLYSNSDHLNRKGAAITSYLLLQKLIDMKYLPKEADGYDYTPRKDLINN